MTSLLFNPVRVFYCLLIAVGAGLIQFTLFEPVASPWGAWFFLLPFVVGFWLIELKGWHAFLTGYLSGVVFWATSIFWITEVTTLGWVALILYLSLYHGVWAWFWWRVLGPPSKRPEELTSLFNIRLGLLGACAWTGLEWVRGTLFSGFPWNYLGVSQARLTGLIQVAEFGGVLLISWLMAFVGICLALTLIRLVNEILQRQRIKAHFEFTLSMLLVAGSFLFGLHTVRTGSEITSKLPYLAVQPNLPQDPWGEGVDSIEAISMLEVLSRSGVSSYPAEGIRPLIIWPETPIGQSILNAPAFLETRDWLDQSGHSLLFGSNVYHPENSYNASVLYHPQNSYPQFYFKNHLVIMGEYVPFTDLLPLLKKLVPPGVNFSHGSAKTLLRLNSPKLQIAPLICFEDVVSGHVREMARQEPDVFINMTNDGWFNESPQSRQHLNIALFRAVEHRIPLLRVTNNGVTAQINEFGMTEKIISDQTGNVQIQGTLLGEMAIPDRPMTVYTRFGDWIGWGSLLAALGYIIFFLVNTLMKTGKSSGSIDQETDSHPKTV
ncbi:MAG: apolipoprotein N-acyltransferase [Verrucomicrobiota bacterium]